MKLQHIINLSITNQFYKIIEEEFDCQHRGILLVTSMYRDKKKNKEVGGSTDSKHLEGKAVDIAILDGKPELIEDTILKLILEGRIPEGGIGIYDSHVHYDWRGHRVRWDERTKHNRHGIVEG